MVTRSIQAMLMIAFLKVVYSGETQCKPEGLENCACTGLMDGTVFVDCKRCNVTIQDVCKICSSIQNVTRIDLGFNELADIPEDCFIHCRNVTSLSLVSNGIKVLKQHTFTNMKQLQQLNLDKNLLIKGGNVSTPEAFNSLVHLKSLSLRANGISPTDTGPYEYLANININTFTALQKLSLDGLPYGSFKLPELSLYRLFRPI